MVAKVDDTTLIAGQNEGIERAVLPLPQLAFVLNARLRKTGRWGKRWGFSKLPTTGLSLTPGDPRCVGPGFAVVDDQCNLFDQTAGSFVTPVPTTQRMNGAASGWLPDRAFFPAPTKSIQHQTATPCATAFAGGYLWTVKQIGDPDVPTAQMLRVVATEIHDQTVVFSQDLRSTTGNAAGIHHPRLVVMGTTLALFYLDGTLLCSRSTIGLAAFGAEHPYSGVGLDPVTAYDVSPYDATSCLYVIAVNSASIKTGRISAALALVVTYTFANPNLITGVSIVGSPTTAVYLGWGMPAVPQTAVRVFTMGFSGAVVGDAILSSTDGTRPLLALRPGGSIVAVYSSKEITASGGLLLGTFTVRYVDALAGIFPVAAPARQLGAAPISMPFVVGDDAYIWAQLLLQQPVTGGGGFPVLLRLDPFLFPTPWTSFPIEMSAQDFVTATGKGLRVTDLQGLPVVSRIGTSATWAALIPILYRTPVTASDILVDFRAVQATHYTDLPEQRSVLSFPCDNSHLIPLGALTRVDAHGPVEVGFVHAPAIAPPVAGAAGGLTPSKTYYYSAVFTSRNESGRVELSAPAVPAKVTLTAGQNSATLSIAALYLSGRKSAQLEIYRTLGDGQTFYLLATLSAGGAGGDQVIYNDLLADDTIKVNPVIYTQVGQQLANGFPPASRFGCAGGARAYVGGLLRGDVAVASKLIVGDQLATFTDWDAFKIIVPADLTGLAWMDALVTFTAEGIYISTGEGPTDDGVGDFGTASRLPFQIGCIEPRSVITVDEGTFFQSNRGLYLLPRGFGAPVAAGDVVMATLAEFPTITGVAALVKPTEQTIRWSCVDSDGDGRQIVYDLVHKAWSIDQPGGGRSGMMCLGPWVNNEVASATGTLTEDAIRVTNDTFEDGAGVPIPMTLRTGDVRPFGVQSRGPVQRFAILTELRSPCTLQVGRLTDRGAGNPTSREFSGVAPDDEVGSNNYTQVDLGPIELRSIAALQIELTEESTGEGLAFIALSIERGASDGLRLEKPADRIV